MTGTTDGPSSTSARESCCIAGPIPSAGLNKVEARWRKEIWTKRFFVPFAAFVFAFVKRSIWAMCLIALGINLGIWLYKYLMVVPVLSPDDQPFSSWLDVIVAAGLAAGFAAAVILLATRFPMYSHWEMALKPIPRR